MPDDYPTHFVEVRPHVALAFLADQCPSCGTLRQTTDALEMPVDTAEERVGATRLDGFPPKTTANGCQDCG